MKTEPTARVERPRGQFDHLAACLLLLVISLPVLVIRLDGYPNVWFDEGYSMHAARTLVARGVYGTYGSAGYQPFDPMVTTGLPVIIPIALSFGLLGIGIVQARLVILSFTLLAIFGLYAISATIYGRAAALFITLVLLAVPEIRGVGFLLVGRQILGESPSLALIAIGLWVWFRGWGRARWSLSLPAGLAFGLGLISKMQVGIVLLPTLVLVAVGRGWKDRSQIIRLLIPAVMLMVAGSWMLIGRLGTPEHLRQENSVSLIDGVWVNLITGLFGRTLSTSAWFILTAMALAALIRGWCLLSRLPEKGLSSDAYWAEITITLLVLCSGLWFGLLSIGWPRYAYGGFILSLLLLAKVLWDTFEWLRRRLIGRWPVIDGTVYPVALAGLVLVVVLTNGYPILRYEQDNRAQEMADYIHSQIPRSAVIESWEWELDALSSHWKSHHPDHRFLHLAMRQYCHEQSSFDLSYDILQADPDYLLTGPFSNWTCVYEPELVETYFVKRAEIGAYSIYERIRQ